ncbi:MAG: hypothetical protein LH485_03795 [Sphingomonas bacterium]|nr:hypothetical protein [Sphingomonas bacterium]
MSRVAILLMTALGLSLTVPALAGAVNFSIMNAAGANLSGLSIRRVGSGQWQSLGVSAQAGTSAAVTFSDPDCAFDLRATLTGGAIVTWPGVNLCAVKLVTLRRNAAGLAWVDYD